jgi:hypothetical protein
MVSAVVDVGDVRDDVVAEIADALLDTVDEALDMAATMAEVLCALGVVIETMLDMKASSESIH